MTTQDARHLARMIDVSCVRAQHGEAEITELATQALHWNCINAHVLPSWLPLLRELIDRSETLAAAPVGFPSGGATSDVKVLEAEQLVNHGVQEMDVVINIGRLIDGDMDYVRDELRQVFAVVPPSVPVKAIIEASLLSDSQIRSATRVVAESGAAYVKTGTGWAGPVTISAVETIAAELKACGAEHVEIKAAGGIRTPSDISQLRAVGATRFGIGLAAAVDILKAVEQS